MEQSLYVRHYPSITGEMPTTIPDVVKNTRITNWVYYKEFAIRSIIDRKGTAYDDSLAPGFWKYNTGTFGEVNVDMVSFFLNKTDYQNGRASDDYVMFGGVAWGDCDGHHAYYGYSWFGNCFTYYWWGQEDKFGHLINSKLFRIVSTDSNSFARSAGCGESWANDSCRTSKNAWINKNLINAKAVFMVR